MAQKKKIKLQDNETDLGHGFIVTIVPHPVGDMSGNLEGFLSYEGEEIEIENKRFYESNTELLHDFDKRIIPIYIKGKNIKVFKYLDDDLMFIFVRDYLTKFKNEITYGKVIDVIKVLEVAGYEIPKDNDKTQVSNLIDFYKCVDRLSNEFKKHLKEYGFPADRNINNTVDHPEFGKHPKCKNIVFTRYPWTTGYKAIKIVNDFISMTENDLTLNTDMKTFKRISPDAHRYLKVVTDTFNKVHYRTNVALEDLEFKDITKEFKAYIKDNRKELLEKWTVRRPRNYGVYSED